MNRSLVVPMVVLALLLLSTACRLDSPPSEPVVIEGASYETVRIAGRTWTAQSYSGPGGIPFRTNEHIADYGRYYTYAEAQAVSLPPGWRIPTLDDFKALAVSQGVVFEAEKAKPQAAVGRLASTTRWRNTPGTNSSGFNAYPGGYSINSSDPVDKDIAEFWAQGSVTFSLQESNVPEWHRIELYDSSMQDVRFNLRFVRD